MQPYYYDVQIRGVSKEGCLIEHSHLDSYWSWHPYWIHQLVKAADFEVKPLSGGGHQHYPWHIDSRGAAYPDCLFVEKAPDPGQKDLISFRRETYAGPAVTSNPYVQHFLCLFYQGAAEVWKSEKQSLVSKWKKLEAEIQQVAWFDFGSKVLQWYVMIRWLVIPAQY